jgi:hypothetical protein
MELLGRSTLSDTPVVATQGKVAPMVEMRWAKVEPSTSPGQRRQGCPGPATEGAAAAAVAQHSILRSADRGKSMVWEVQVC